MTGSNYGFWNSDGSFNHEVIFNLSRTYAYAIAGQPLRMHYNHSTADLNLTYIPNSHVSLRLLFSPPSPPVTHEALGQPHRDLRIRVASLSKGPPVSLKLSSISL